MRLGLKTYTSMFWVNHVCLHGYKKQNKAKQNKTKQNKTKHNKTKQNKTKTLIILKVSQAKEIHFL